MFLNIAGVKVERFEPAGPPNGRKVLFVHGVLAGSWIWHNWLGHFAARGYDAYAINLRGHGGGRAVPDIGRVSFHEYVEDARRVAEDLGNPILVGHSMGGMVVQKVREALDPSHAVVLCSAPPRGILGMYSPGMFAASFSHAADCLFWRPLLLTRHEMDTLGTNLCTPEVQQTVYERMTPESGRHLLELAIPGVPVDPRRSRGELLCVGAAHDRTIPAAVVRRIARHYDAPYREYHDHAHMIILEPGWEAVARDTADWLAARGALAGAGTERP